MAIGAWTASDVGLQIGLPMPDGKGSVAVKRMGITVYSNGNAVSPLHLSNQLINPVTVPVDNFQKRLEQLRK